MLIGCYANSKAENTRKGVRSGAGAVRHGNAGKQRSGVLPGVCRSIAAASTASEEGQGQCSERSNATWGGSLRGPAGLCCSGQGRQLVPGSRVHDECVTSSFLLPPFSPSQGIAILARAREVSHHQFSAAFRVFPKVVKPAEA